MSHAFLCLGQCLHLLGAELLPIKACVADTNLPIKADVICSAVNRIISTNQIRSLVFPGCGESGGDGHSFWVLERWPQVHPPC